MIEPEASTFARPGALPVGPSAARPLPDAQAVWLRAAEATDPLDRHDVLAVVLEVLRAAHHDVVTVSRALTIGRRCALDHPSDVAVQRGVEFLEQALTFMGAELPAGNR